ncbi:hypothetical protein CSC94_21460 [Zhengella mangrovi]|uniref:Uncharacterized protein n=1 Tax=Zhengella mangrovi TaxID=1982044 RepID=A0A2G1QHA9_9HYPH|nr:hypothetical protein CSC94_21460 [Zhengella mangrovi]
MLLLAAIPNAKPGSTFAGIALAVQAREIEFSDSQRCLRASPGILANSVGYCSKYLLVKEFFRHMRSGMIVGQSCYRSYLFLDIRNIHFHTSKLRALCLWVREYTDNSFVRVTMLIKQ